MYMDIIALILSIVGCLNWGLVGIFSSDLVAWLFGAGSIISHILYTIIALAGIWTVSFFFRRSNLAREEA